MILFLQKTENIMFTLKINSSLFTKYIRKKSETPYNTPFKSVSFTLTFLHAYLFYITEVLLYREF